MTLPSNVLVAQFRGATIMFSTTFYDVNNNVTYPMGATLTLLYLSADDSTQTSISIPMVQPVFPATAWTAMWDSRNAGPGVVSCSIHSIGPAPPYSVEDFQFLLNANPANLVTF